MPAAYAGRRRYRRRCPVELNIQICQYATVDNPRLTPDYVKPPRLRGARYARSSEARLRLSELLIIESDVALLDTPTMFRQAVFHDYANLRYI